MPVCGLLDFTLDEDCKILLLKLYLPNYGSSSNITKLNHNLNYFRHKRTAKTDVTKINQIKIIYKSFEIIMFSLTYFWRLKFFKHFNINALILLLNILIFIYYFCSVIQPAVSPEQAARAHLDRDAYRAIADLSKECPKCGASIHKYSGCNHVTCTCGHDFCWLCLEEWTTDHQRHWFDDHL